MIAEELAQQINQKYPGGRDIEITVAEDNENGATMSFTDKGE